MATPDLTSLFGQDPQLLQQAMDIQAAKLTPEERLYTMGAQTGRSIGQGLGSLFGVEVQDPLVQKATALRSLAKEFDTTTPEGLMQFAQAASKIDPRAGVLAAQQAQAMLETQSKIAKNMKVSPGTASERSREMISKLEVKLAKKEELSPEEQAQARWLIAQETKPKAFRDAESGELITIQPLDINQAAPNLARFLSGGQAAAPVTPGAAPSEVGQTVSPAPGVTITKVGEGKGLDAGTVKELGNIDANLTKLGSSVSSLKNIGSRIDKLDLGLVQNLARGGAATLGINTADRTEFDSLQRTALKEANNLLLLAKGAQTEGDAQRARDQIADPNTWKNKDALKKAFEDLQATHEQTIEALTAQRKTLTSKGKAPAPSGAGEYSKAQEDLISRWMAANKRSREDVISYLKSQGKL